MRDINIILRQLENFRLKRKFTTTDWEKRELIPPSQNISSLMEDNINTCTESLIHLVKQKSNKWKLRNGLINGLYLFRKSDYNSDERQLICTYFDSLSSILKINIDFRLNSFTFSWLSAVFLSIVTVLIFKDHFVDNHIHNCETCGAKLESLILEKDYNLKDSGYIIVKCYICGNYNLIELCPEIKRFKSRNYELIEIFSGNNHNQEQAKIRFEQIRLFRK